MYSVIETPLGKMQARGSGDFLTHLHFCISPVNNQFKNEDISLYTELQSEINAYFSGKLKQFSIPYQLEGTSFQKTIWCELAKIPYGQTCSYFDIAQSIKSPKASQAIGQANKKNPIQLIIPCHRVIRKNKELGGYVTGAKIKNFLIQHEAHNLSY